MIEKLLKPVSIFAVLALALMPAHGYCLPAGEQVVEGSASFDRSQANTLIVNQGTDKMIANYNSFSIGLPEAVNFVQPSPASVALNRVVGVDPSLILGTLTANGRIFLINPNGVMFGQGCKVDTMGLVASTLNMSNADFMAGRYSFVGDGGSVINLGLLSAPGGYVALLGSRVENQGVIEAELGSVALASGKAVTLKLDPKGLISVVVDEAAISNADNADDAVKNSGTIMANGGKVLLTAKALDGVFKKVVNTDGLIEANSIGDVMGQVVVEANQRVAIGGRINAKGGIVRVDCQGADFTGAINARLGNFNMNDGDTFIAGNYIGDYIVTDNLHINVTGDTTVSDGVIFVYADNDHNGSGDLLVDNASLIANNGDIQLTGVNIRIEDSLIAATRSFGVVFVDVKAQNDLTINGTGGEEGNISSVSADMYENGDAFVTLTAGTVPGAAASKLSITNSDVTARIYGDGHAHAGIYNNNGAVTMTGSQILAHIASGVTTAEVDIEAAGDINVDDTAITALVDNSGTAEVYLNPLKGGINISNGSAVAAQVGSDGEAGVYMYDYEYDNIIYIPLIGDDIDFGGAIPGDISISGNSQVTAAAANEYGGETAVVYMNTEGSINFSDNSSIEATELYGEAAVAMIAGEDINIDETSRVTASSADSVSAVLGIAGNNINSYGPVDAYNNDGVSLIGLLAMNDVYVASSTARTFASGGSDGIDMLEDLINGYIGGDDPTQSITIDRRYSYNGFSLFGSEMGNIYLGDVSADLVGVVATGMSGEGTGTIYDAGGTVSANYLAMLAACDIGNAEAPIQTDVDIVSAYSYAKGDIYLNQINGDRMIELGLFLPVSLYNYGELYEDQIGIGASVAARDGIVHVTSEGDMMVNSVIAARGGVFLESRNGNIYTGRGWSPVVLQGTVDSPAYIFDGVVDLIFTAGSDESNEAHEFVAGLFDDFFMDSLFPSSSEERKYLSPFMMNLPLDAGANVWATGYSYFSAPHGTIGVEATDDADLQGAIKGFVRPGVSDVLSPRPGFDLVPVSGYVAYEDDVYGGPEQIWPDPEVTSFSFEGPQKPLVVNIQLSEGSASAAPVRGDEYEQPFSPVSGLTLNYAQALPPIPTPSSEESFGFVDPLARSIRVYYEILSIHRFVSNEPATPTTFFGYRPLTPTNMSAFDDVNLDAGAYDFISDNIKTKRPLSPYYGL